MTMRHSTGLKNKGLGQEINLVSNGDFDSGVTGWVASASTLSQDATGGVDGGGALQIENSGAAAGAAFTDVTTEIGKTYNLEFYITGGSAGNTLQVLVGTAADDDAVCTTGFFAIDASTKRKVSFVATDTTTRLTLKASSVTTSDTIILDKVISDAFQDGYREIFRGSFINYYTGTQPASADDAATGTLICTISDPNNNGLEWEGASGGQLTQPSNIVWSGQIVSPGTVQIGWARLYEAGDDPSVSSTTAARIDASVGTSNADIIMQNVSAANGASITLDNSTISVA